LWGKGYKRVAGLDEAGRGPLAGPVVAAAVIIEDKKLNQAKLSRFKLDGINDSKKLRPKKREKFYSILTNPFRHLSAGANWRMVDGGWQIEWGIGRVSEKVIDKINIKNAAELAMERAVKKLKRQPDFLIIDGKYLKNHKLKTINHKLIIKADEKVFSCSAASIIAKVSRDRIMQRYHKKYPQYGFDKHKGYPTKYHIRMLTKYGPCKIHRKSFKPVRLALVPDGAGLAK
jgi:ribonuclease HII